MKKLTIPFLIIFFFTIQIIPQTKERKDIPEKYKWNLNDIYPSVSEWQKASDKIKTDINKITS